MVIKIHGIHGTTCTQRVLTILYEKDVPYELIPVDWRNMEHKSEDFIKYFHPFGRVPVLEDDDGFILFESRAIAKYIDKKYGAQGTKLTPDEGDLKGYALYEQACMLENIYFDKGAFGLAWENVFKRQKGDGEPDGVMVAKHAAQLDETLAVYERILSERKYLAGDELTLADLFHLPYGVMVRDLGYTSIFEDYPHVAKWFDGLMARESWKQVASFGFRKP
ncbi:glutathione S-transferase [Apodospora peruviana]|uniref:glutathione transferase n=1 Tax=Apodospora peruviana TaxID=516989 RepID=A0AAE0IDB0_9PEZI|nr:glutathione S-transferase [Apodospora peruviana]